VNSAWKNIDAVRNFQPFQLPAINKPLILTKYEKAFRQEHNLCARCGNHSDSDGKQCELHPLYEDIKINDKSILGRDITSFLNGTSTAAIASHSINYSVHPPANDTLNKLFPNWRRELMAKSGEQAPPSLNTTAEIMAPDESWLAVNVALDTHSQRCFVTDSFVRKFNLDRLTAQPPNSLAIRAHLHKTLMISDRALWVRLTIDNHITDAMAYVVDGSDSDELILGMDWMRNYNVSLPRDTNNDIRAVIGRKDDPWPQPRQDDTDEDKPETGEPVDIAPLSVELYSPGREHVEKYKQSVFNPSEYNISQTLINGQSYEMPIDVIDADHQPDAVRYIPIADQDRDEAKAILSTMVRNGQLKKETTRYLHPTYFLRKKESGKLRFISDMTAINSKVRHQPINLPHIKDLIDGLGQSKHFTILDISDAFHQLSVKPEHTKYLGIATPFGQFTYQVAPMGFCNSPTYWQQYIETALQDVIGHGVSVYMDDIIIHTQGTLEDHNLLVDKVLEILEKYNLKCNAAKCKFNAKAFKFLGHWIEVSDAGVTIEISSEYKKAIQNLSPPHTLKQLQRIIGTVGWVRNWIPNFAGKTRLLQSKMAIMQRTNSNRLRLTQDETEEFEAIKRELVSSKALHLLDPGLETLLYTDASYFGLGAVLLQTNPTLPKIGNRIIGYYSHKNTGPESRYKTYELELHALVKALEHFQHILVGRKVQVFTDHRALLNLRNNQPTIPRHFGWLSRLNRFNL
jgi:hypothetical protein